MSVKKASKTTKLIDVISSMSTDYIDSLTIEQLVRASQKLFKLVNFCSCIRSNEITEMPSHSCSIFNRRDTVHITDCEYCQTKLFLTYFSLALKLLDERVQLPEFSQNALTRAKVRDRTFGFTMSKSKLRFRIIRHYNAWRYLGRYEHKGIQEWEFDFEKFSLSKIY